MSRAGKFRLAVVLLALAGLAAVVVWAPELLDWDSLMAREEAAREALRERPVVTLAVVFPIYVLLAAFALPGMPTVLAFTTGWLCGFWLGLPLVSCAATAGGCLTFLLGRYVARDWVRGHLAKRWPAIAKAVELQGPAYLWTARLLPATPFAIFNLLMGLGPMRLPTFWLITQIGMLPGTCLYVYAGSQIPPLADLREHGVSGVMTSGLIAALVALSTLPLLVSWWLRRPSREM